MEKTQLQKSHATVPLKLVSNENSWGCSLKGQIWFGQAWAFQSLSLVVFRMMVTVKITVHVDYAKLFQYWNAARDNFIIYNPPFV